MMKRSTVCPIPVESYTFHGRDIYAYTGARLASGAITLSRWGRRFRRTA